MSDKIEYLKINSNLPGPRGNLELLKFFSRSASIDEVEECLAYNNEELGNSPEEFVVMCGIVGYSYINRFDISGVLDVIRPFASHRSWRIREAVAMGIQELGEVDMEEAISNLKSWVNGNELEQRTLAAGLCEPKLLKNENQVMELLEMLKIITLNFNKFNIKLSEDQKVLRKGLGYCWSVAIVPFPSMGIKYFDEISSEENKHIQWIVNNNLKKKRLIKVLTLQKE